MISHPRNDGQKKRPDQRAVLFKTELCNFLNVRSLLALRAISNIKTYTFIFFKTLVTRVYDCGEVRE